MTFLIQIHGTFIHPLQKPLLFGENKKLFSVICHYLKRYGKRQCFSQK